MLNVPLTDRLALRLAGSGLKRAGFIHDSVHDTDVDGRELWSGRATLAFRGNAFSSWLMWEHFEEDDDRYRAGKQLCKTDSGPTTVGGQSTTQTRQGYVAQWFLSQGCLPASLYDAQAFGVVNGNATLGGLFSNLIGLQSGNAFAGTQVDHDLRSTAATILPSYQARSDLAELNMEWNPVQNLLFTSLTKEVRTVPRAREEARLRLPECFKRLKAEQQTGALAALERVDPALRQLVLDEWAARCQAATVRNPAGYLFGIIQKALQGEFHATRKSTDGKPL